MCQRQPRPVVRGRKVDKSFQIWQLHMPLKKKIAVTAVFLLGFITLAASVTRSAIFINAVNGTLTPSIATNKSRTNIS